MAISPAVNTTQSAGLLQLATVYYQKQGLSMLYQMLRFQSACTPQDLPNMVGKTVQMWRGVLPGGNTAPSAEGVVGTGLPLTTQTLTATVENYSDFTSTSALLEETAINNMITLASELMSYRAALSTDLITRAEIDGSGVTIQTPIGSTAAIADLRKQVALLQGANVLPFDGGQNEPGGGYFLCVIKPEVLYDVTADSTAGGFIDISKYAANTNMRLFSGEVGKAAQCRIVTTSNVGDDGVAATSTGYYTYFFGADAVGAVSLAGRGPSNVIDPSKSQFKLAITKGGPAGFDPAGEIGTFVAYRFVYCAKVLQSSPYRYAIVKCNSSII
jgi:N4-gp56 family major capsid protein